MAGTTTADNPGKPRTQRHATRRLGPGGGVYDPNRKEFIRDSYLVCPPDMAAPSGSQGPCGSPLGTVNLEIYHPHERYWLLQTLEAGVFLVLAVLLIVLAVHQIRRRIT